VTALRSSKERETKIKRIPRTIPKETSSALRRLSATSRKVWRKAS